MICCSFFEETCVFLTFFAQEAAERDSTALTLLLNSRGRGARDDVVGVLLAGGMAESSEQRASAHLVGC
jgi:hypothetical protein